jgi:nuclear pore complex protein Nup54
MKTVELLRNKGYPIRSEEEALRTRLEAMDEQLKKPAYFRGRVPELQATLRLLQDSRKIGSAGSRDGETGADYAYVDEQQMGFIGEVCTL